MTVRVDYTQLDQPIVRLSLARSRGGLYSVTDQHGRLYFPPVQDISVCLRFLAAMAERKDAVIDDASIERATWAITLDGEFDAKVPDEPSNVIHLPRRETA